MGNQYIRLTLLGLILVTNVIVAKPKIEAPNTLISVHVFDKDLLKDELVLFLIKDEIYYNVEAVKYVSKADENGIYTFKIPKIMSLARFSLSFTNKEVLTDYYIEPGDNINIEFRNFRTKNSVGKKMDTLIFSGAGSQKSEAYYALLKTKVNNRIRPHPAAPFSEKFLDTLHAMSDSTYLFKRRLLSSYKKYIVPKTLARMELDLFGLSYFSFYDFLSQQYQDPQKRLLVRSYYERIKSKEYEIENEYLYSESSNYVRFLLAKINLTALVKLDEKFPRRNDVSRIIIKTTSGLLREKLLTNYYLGLGLLDMVPNDADTSSDEKMIADGLTYIQNPIYHQIISNLTKARSKGTNAYVFKLPDTSGKMISLTDFKGKVVMIDCWFTGCSSCAMMADTIDRQVIPLYENNPNIVFISVNVDRKKEVWKKSILSGIYTNPKSINLYTEGLELEHPFIKNYRFQGFPHIMLIDKAGKVFSAEMPRRGRDMVKIINDALNKQVSP